jgi:2-amino-4-hydroxy-6-hydroxymethyldihydropteridine diphosphokinase
MTEIAYIGAGSNLGDRAAHIEAAVARIDGHPGCRVRGVSPIYETEPLGEDAGGWFLNAAFSVETELSPRELLELLQEVEKAAGRERRRKWASRTLDLDILFFGDRIIEEEDLLIPHPQIHLRRFVLLPLKEIAPDFIHPVLGRSVSLLYESLEDGLKARPYKK